MSVPKRATDHDEHWPDEVAAYVLRALDSPDLERFEHHLSSCPVCRDDVSSLKVVLDALPVAVTPVTPPAELKDRIMNTVRAEAELLAAASAPSGAPVRRRRWTGFSLGLRPAFALSGVGALAVGLTIGGLVFSGPGAPVSHLQVASVDTAAEPGASAHVQRSANNVSLVVDRLPSPPPGRVYELWLKRPGQAPQPATLFSLHSGSVSVPGDLHGVRTIMVTAEPVGGSRVPTRQPVIVDTLS